MECWSRAWSQGEPSSTWTWWTPSDSRTCSSSRPSTSRRGQDDRSTGAGTSGLLRPLDVEVAQLAGRDPDRLDVVDRRVRHEDLGVDQVRQVGGDVRVEGQDAHDGP